MNAPTVLEPTEAKRLALELRAGQRMRVVWRQVDDAAIQNWVGTVFEVKENWIVVQYDDGPPDPSTKYDLPYQAPCVEYLSTGPENSNKSAGNMLAALRMRPSLFNITEWRPLTWAHLLHPTSGDRVTSRALLINELKVF